MSEAANGPAVTVVIPTKDRGDLLAQTLRSVHEQTEPPARVIVADDGSTDDTPAVVEQADAERLYNPQGDWGAGRARNAALAAVRNELVAFVDSDDLLLPGALEALTKALAAAPSAPFAYGRAITARRDDGGWTGDALIGPDPDELHDPLCSLFARNSVPSSGVLARASALREVGGYDESVTWAEDHHLWVRLALLGDPAYTPALVCVHRRHGGNRHTPRVAHRDADAILGLAEKDPRLAACMPQRIGVELCEVGISTLKERPAELPRTVRRLVAGRTGVRAALRRGAIHWRARRRWARAGSRMWREDDELRAWLASYQ
jgi:glycosyltransferase involved in cell wall biosynthesis